MKIKNIKVGDLIKVSEIPNATIYEVEEVDGFYLQIKEYKTDYKSQFIDVSQVTRKVA